MQKLTVKDIELSGKKVLLRVDFNVPIKDGKITDENRIIQALPTINHILNKGAKLIIFSHLGRVKTEEDKKDKSLNIVSERLEELLSKPVKFINKTRGTELETAISNMSSGDVLMFENTRFEDVDGKKESSNNEELGKYWASLGDVFVNDAFGTAHRAHASNAGIANNIDVAVAGLLLEKEIEYIGGVVDKPKKPLVTILGGAKVSDKIDVINSLLDKSDKILIGGGMSFTFYKAQGINIGKSLCEDDKIDLAKSLLEKANGKILLPTDVVCAKEFSNDAAKRITSVTDIKDDEMGLDCGPESVELFKNEIKKAKTVLWNGPMGVFEMPNFAKGTIGVCQAIAEEDVISIIGGGDSAAAAIQNGFENDFTHISTGGGASLNYLEGKILPGIQTLNNK